MLMKTLPIRIKRMSYNFIFTWIYFFFSVCLKGKAKIIHFEWTFSRLLYRFSLLLWEKAQFTTIKCNLWAFVLENLPNNRLRIKAICDKFSVNLSQLNTAKLYNNKSHEMFYFISPESNKLPSAALEHFLYWCIKRLKHAEVEPLREDW